MGIRVLGRVAGLVLAGAVVIACSGEPRAVPDSSESQRVAVRRVVDGDTLVLDGGPRVRLIGIDTPERDECGSAAATRALEKLVEGRDVVLVNPGEVQDQDQFGRLLRYVDVGGRDAGMAQLEAGHAVARYDSEDGYDPHPREVDYRAADAAAPPSCPE